MECANENLRSDLERWHVEKKKDIRGLLLSMANQQIQFYEDVSVLFCCQTAMFFRYLYYS